MAEETNEKVNTVHLGYIQTTITRMGQNSFQAKTWCITIIAALLAFYLSQERTTIHIITFLISIVVILFFCLIDVYYLYLERGYRYLYNIVAKLDKTEKVSDFDMKIPKSARGLKNFLKAMGSPSTGIFYGILIFLLVLLMIFYR